jgi:dTDP-glucose 4,6-dehydratase
MPPAVTPSPPLPAEDLEHVLNRTAHLWEEARGKSFFITGGTGFFGVWLLESFVRINAALNLQARATVLSRNPESFRQRIPHLASRPELRFHQDDMRDFSFPEGKFDFILHAATDVGTGGTGADWGNTFTTILDGTRRVLDFAAQAKPEKFLLTSSGAVYGAQPPDLTHVPETFSGAPDPLLDAAAYGEGKRAAEHIASVHARKFGYQLKIARCFAFVGPHLPLNAHFAIGNFISAAMSGKTIRIAGDGTPMRSYLYASDLMVWLWTLLFKGSAGRAYNIGASQDLSIRQLACLVRSTLFPSGSVMTAKSPDPSAPVSRYVPCVGRARTELDLREEIPLQAAVQKTADWHRTSFPSQSPIARPI